MSAFICDDMHVSAIVSYMIYNRVSFWHPRNKEHVHVTLGNAQHVGMILHAENVRSVNYRHNESEPTGFAFKYFPSPLTPVEVIKACKCLDYQSCETDDWEGTLAWSILQAVINHALPKLAGYEAAPWEITDASREKLTHNGAILLSRIGRQA